MKSGYQESTREGMFSGLIIQNGHSIALCFENFKTIKYVPFFLSFALTFL